MSRKAKYQADTPCPYPDCFSCPHPDCIKERTPVPGRRRAASPAGKKPGGGRPSRYAGMSPEAVKAAKAALNREWRRNHPENVQRTAAAYRERNREEINRKNRERYRKKQEQEMEHGQKHLSDGQAGQRPDPGAGG